MSINTKVDGSPEDIRAAARWLREIFMTAVSRSTDSAFFARNLAQQQLAGEAAEALSKKLTTGGQQAEDFHEAISGSMKVADTAAGYLQRAQDEMQQIRSEAASAGLEVFGDTINEPGTAPAAAGAAPSGAKATPAAVAQYEGAVAAEQKHHAMVEAYNRAQTDVENVRRRWQQQVQKASSDWQNMKVRHIFTVAGFGLSGGTVAAAAHQSVLVKEADFLDSKASTAAKHARIIGGTDPAGFYKNLDAAKEYTRAAESTAARSARVNSTSTKVGNIGGGVLAAGGVVYDIAHGKPVDQAIVSGGAGFGASVGAGLAAGAVIGGPVGAGIGAVGGVIVGAFTSGAVDSLYENGVGALGTAIEEGGKAVHDTVTGLGSAAKDLGEGVVSGVKDVWNAIF